MRVIIAGSRTIEDYDIVKAAIAESGFAITTVLCGKAKGVDTLGERFALENNIEISYHPADWDKYGKSAGYVRNESMGKRADALIDVWDGESMGTGHMINVAKRRGLITHVKLTVPNEYVEKNYPQAYNNIQG